MSVEEAFTLIISAGIVTPQERKSEEVLVALPTGGSICKE